MDNPISLAYRRGTELEVMPLPPIPEHCVEVPAGPVRFIVESRDVAADLAAQGLLPKRESEGAPLLTDAGASLHVLGTEDGKEHLRFDCFDQEPHYHYVKHGTERNHVVRIDEIAEGDPVAWTVQRVRNRLPEMLEYAGAGDIAAAVRADSVAVTAAIDKLAGLLSQAQEQVQRQRTS